MIRANKKPTLHVKPTFRKNSSLVKNISEDIFKKFNKYSASILKKKKHKRNKDKLLEERLDNTLKTYSVFEKIKSIGEISDVKDVVSLILNNPEVISDPTLAKQIIEGHLDISENVIKIMSTYYLKKFNDEDKEYLDGGSIFDLYYPVAEHTRQGGKVTVRAHYRMYRYR